MKNFPLALLILLSSSSMGINVTIVESQSFLSGHTMDNVWKNVATGMGYSATIMPQTVLDDTSFFSTTDILIVSSGVIKLPMNRINTILQYTQQGGMTYIQAEYDCGFFDANYAFEYIINYIGVDFKWMGTVSGNLSPMAISGTPSNNLNTVSSLDYFWYGCHGVSNDMCGSITPFMRNGGQDFGFIFTSSNPSYGNIICTSDQDWIKNSTSLPLVENILHFLSDHTTSPGLIVNLGKDTSVCKGNLVSLDAGITSATYLWSNGNTTQTIQVGDTGKYWVEATIGNCTSTDTVLIKYNVTEAGSILPTGDTICSGESETLTTFGNAGAIQWQYSPDGVTFISIPGADSFLYQASVLNQNTFYRVTTSGICGSDSTNSVLINVLANSEAGIISALRDTICQGTPVSLTLAGNTGSIEWQSKALSNFSTIPGVTTSYYISPLSQTSLFRVIAGTGICADTSADYKIVVIESPSAVFSFDSLGLKVKFNSSGSSPDVTSWNWDFGDGTTNTDANPEHTFSMPDTFHVCLTVFNGSNCSYTICMDVNVKIAIGMSNIEEQNDWSIYPNPAGDLLTVSLQSPGRQAEIKVVNLIGEEVYIKKITGKQLIDAGNLPAGIYFVRLHSGSKEKVMKLVITH